MILKTLNTGDRIRRREDSVIVDLGGRRKVISTGPINPGISYGLKSVFNIDLAGKTGEINLKADSYKDHMYYEARDLGLDPEKTTGLSTTVNMDNLSLVTKSYRDLSLTALVTAGIDVNGGRVGDPAGFYELNENFTDLGRGTINIILISNVDLDESALTRSIITITEAKTAALQELKLGSKYSRGLATGSGTDGIIVVANRDSEISLTNTGKHSKMGELIGLSVKEAVKEALDRQTQANPLTQRNILRRLDRFKIDHEYFYGRYRGGLDFKDFKAELDRLGRDPLLVARLSTILNLIDEMDWGLICPTNCQQLAGEILSSPELINSSKLGEGKFETVDKSIKLILDCFVDKILSEIK